MVNYDAFVMEIEPDNTYFVWIDGVYMGKITDSGITFETALARAIEFMLTNEYEIKTVKLHPSCEEGCTWMQYVVLIDENV